LTACNLFNLLHLPADRQVRKHSFFSNGVNSDRILPVSQRGEKVELGAVSNI